MSHSADTNPRRQLPRVMQMVAVEVVEEADLPLALPADPIPPKRGFIGRCVGVIGSILEWLFGVASLFIGLAILAALPLFQFLSLGYLLEAGGRVARTRRLRDGFIGVRLAARLGGMVIGCWLMLLPARFVADLARSSQIIDSDGRTAANWRFGLLVLIGLTFVHIVAACARGGKLRYFVWIG